MEFRKLLPRKFWYLEGNIDILEEILEILVFGRNFGIWRGNFGILREILVFGGKFWYLEEILGIWREFWYLEGILVFGGNFDIGGEKF